MATLAFTFPPIGPTDDRRTLAQLTVAFSLAASDPEAQLIFTPSPVSSVVTVVGLPAATVPDLGRGRAELRSWLAAQSRSLPSRARWRALWELAARPLDLDSLPAMVDSLTETELEAAKAAWGMTP